MPFCTACGEPVPENSAACPSCGGNSGPAAPLVWTRKVPLISNRILIRDMFLMFMGLGFAICTILVLLTGDITLFVPFLAVFLGLFLLCLVIMFALEWRYGGGLPTRFIVDTDGASHHAGREVRAIDSGTTLGAAAGLSMAGTGAGLIARSQEENGIAWGDVRYARVYKKLRFIELRSKYLINPVALYCTEENFTAVLKIVQERVPKAASLRIHE